MEINEIPEYIKQPLKICSFMDKDKEIIDICLNSETRILVGPKNKSKKWMRIGNVILALVLLVIMIIQNRLIADKKMTVIDRFIQK